MINTHTAFRTAAVALLATAAFPLTPSFAQETAAPPVAATEPPAAPPPAEAPPPVFQPSAPVVQQIAPEATGPAPVAAEQSRAPARATTSRPATRAAAVRAAPAQPTIAPPSPAPAPVLAVTPTPTRSPVMVPPVAVDPTTLPAAQPATTNVVAGSGAPWLFGLIGAFLLAAIAGIVLLMRRPKAMIVDRRQPKVAPRPSQASASAAPPRVATRVEEIEEPVAVAPVEERAMAARRTPQRLTRAAHPVVTDGARHPVAKRPAHRVAVRHAQSKTAHPAERSKVRTLEDA